MDAVYRLSTFSSSPFLPSTRRPDPSFPSFHPPVITSDASPLFVAVRSPGPLMHRIGTAWRRRAEPDSRTRKDPMQVEGENDARHGEDEELAKELEELQEEAIAGKDEGRAPTDYSRRAHIFSESSRVFRALKDRDGQPTGYDSKNHRILRSE